jgi:BirA family biotin operon repressor/biotin-[acetyl-CoA-carboxylase] ligase
MSEESATPSAVENSPGEALLQASSPRRYFVEVTRLEMATSTNEVLATLARDGAPDGAVVVADEQSAGRGRRSRPWISPPGSSLLCSILFRPQIPADQLHNLSSIVGLAALYASRTFGAVKISLKWPNDVITPDGKLAGVLAEVVSAAPAAVVVGIGCNLFWPPNWPPADDPAGLAELMKGATTLGVASGVAVGRDVFLAEFLHQLDSLYHQLLSRSGFARIAEQYRRECSTIGTRVRVETPTGNFVGLAVGITDGGLLEIDVAGEHRVINVADVVHLRAVEPST